MFYPILTIVSISSIVILDSVVFLVCFNACKHWHFIESYEEYVNVYCHIFPMKGVSSILLWAGKTKIVFGYRPANSSEFLPYR